MGCVFFISLDVILCFSHFELQVLLVFILDIMCERGLLHLEPQVNADFFRCCSVLVGQQTAVVEFLRKRTESL